MENERRKQKYLDKLREPSLEKLNKDNRVLEIQNNKFSNFNERQFVEPIFEKDDLLAKVERYIRANPLSHISKDRLTRGLAIKKGSQQTCLRSNIDNKKKLYKSRGIHNVENKISFNKTNEKLVNLDTKINFGTPNATSTIKQQSITQYILVSPKNKNKSNATVNENNVSDDEKKVSSECLSFNRPCSSSKLASSNVINRNNNIQGCLNTMFKQKLNKKAHISIENRAKLNLTYCLYLEFVHRNCDVIKNLNEKIFPNNEYNSINLKNQLQQIKLEHLNKHREIETNLSNTFNSDRNNKYEDSFKNLSSGSINNFNDFIFKPVIDLEFNSSETSCVSLFSKDSFVGLTQETLLTNIDDDSMHIDHTMPELDVESFSSPEIYKIKNKKNLKKKIDYFQSKLVCLNSFDTSSD